MKKIIIALFIIASSFVACSQTVVKDKDGNYNLPERTTVTKTDSLTGKKFTDRDGNTYPVYVSKNGKLFIIRVSKRGNTYRSYLKIEGGN